MKVIESVAEKIAAVLQDWDVEFGDNIVNDICKAAGVPGTLVIGELGVERRKVFPGRTDNGLCYKNEITFHGSDINLICYIPEGAIDDDNFFRIKYAYTREDLYDLVDEHVLRHGLSDSVDQLTEELFDTLDWQFPETIIDQWSESLKNE